MGYKDPEKQREYNRQYRLKNKERLDAYMKQWHIDHYEYRREYTKRYQIENRDKISKRRKLKYRNECIAKWDQHEKKCIDDTSRGINNVN